MLYKLSKTSETFDTLEPLPFKDLADLGHVEKDLENLLCENLLEVLFEDNQLMPLFQERARQEEADIYALDKNGNLVIFELKRATAGVDAVHQALRYCEAAAQWNFEKLQKKFRAYKNNFDLSLQEEHQVNFDLDTPLSKNFFNQQQKLIIVGSAGSNGLVRNIDYWHSKGVEISFVPYRIYQINEETYFEFFSPPYDSHSNPAHRKGVIFDTCRTYIKDSIWYMCDNNRLAAFGDQKHIVGYLNRGDTVFLYHKGKGIVAAGLVKSGIKEDASHDAMYRDLEWLTSLPDRANIKAMSASLIKEVLERNFFWARTIKTPYLPAEDSEKLLTFLDSFLKENQQN